MNMVKHKLSLSVLDFKKRAEIIHDKKYSYENVSFMNVQDKVKINCKEHGIFEQRVKDHLYNKQGCPKCRNRVVNTEDFIKKSNEIHNNTYNYEKTIYNGKYEDVIIECKIHGQFKQKAYLHFRSGCRKCVLESTKIKNSMTLEHFLKMSNKVHGDSYDYSLVKFLNSKTNITIKCKKHGCFEQKPYIHLRGSGCKECSNENTKFYDNHEKWENIVEKKNGKYYFYIVRLFNDNESFFKFGITSCKIERRMSYVKYNYEIIRIISGDCKGIFNKENIIKKETEKFKHIPIKKFSGRTECFICDYSDLEKIINLIC